MNLVNVNQTPKTRVSSAVLTFVTVSVVATAIDVLGLIVVPRCNPRSAAALIVAMLPLPGNLALIFLALRAVRKLDEFKQRIHFEAVVFAFLATGVTVFIYSFLHQALIVSTLNAGLVWLFMIVCYACGYLIALRRYK